jgi:hypothetical protein
LLQQHHHCTTITSDTVTIADNPPSLTFSISDNTIVFGGLSASADRYATGDLSVSAAEIEANTLSVTTNSANGYNVLIQGATLTDGAKTIDAIGGISTASTVGSEQFGVRFEASGGVGAVLAPYTTASQYAYGATSSSTDQIANAASGDGVATVYSARYISNINSLTEAGSYDTDIACILVPSF